MRDCSAVRLAWALVDDALEPVARYAGLPPDARPPARCPVCRGPVTLKLGERRMHHAAHQPGVRCPLEHGETALHLNAKCALRAALAAAAAPDAELAVRLRCPSPVRDVGTGRRARCGAAHVAPLARGWERVEVETALGSTRPDVTLWRDGRVVAALEVVVTHGVSDDKARRLAGLGVPWAAVDATTIEPLPDAHVGPRRAWTPAEPLDALGAATPAGALGGTTGTWRCAPHERAAAAARRRRDNGERPWLARVVDLYHADGRHERDVVVMEAELRAGRVVAVRLVHRLDDDVIAKEVRPQRERTKRALHAAFLAWCARRRADGTRVDSPMPWTAAGRLRAPTGDARGAPGDGWRTHEIYFPRRYRFDRAAGRWEPVVRRDGAVAWRVG